ncbi:MAG: long-chain fatty acid--CoA ligase [Xanthobacteraceae bacterium]|jgi:long-chain acyl-CoA synthetase|nr:long-chain fatty acid--CoA ligase [Xanthobacteraceae bacterium]
MNLQEQPAGGWPYAPGGGDGATFQKLLLDHALLRGARPAFREKKRGIWHTTSWSDLADEASALAAGLAARGLKRGASIAFVADNRPRLYATMSAAHMLGAVAVPLHQDAAPEELAAAIRRVGVTHVFAEDQEQVDKLLQVLPGCPALTTIVYDDDRGMRHYRQPELVSYDTLLRQGRELAAGRREILLAEAAQGQPDDPAFLFFTSGTTGPAKGVVLTHAALIKRARAAATAEGLGEADVTMAYLPPGWIGQNLFSYVQPMVVGYCVCCPESSETMLADMREIGPTYLLAPPRVLEALLTQVTLRIEDAGAFNRSLYRLCMGAGRRARASGAGSAGDRVLTLFGEPLIYGPLRDVLGMSRIRVAYAAGDAADPDLVGFFRALGVNLKPLYGSTETGFFVATQREGDFRHGTVGRAVEGVEIALSPEREVLVRSAGLFREYHDDAEATERSRAGDGWVRTGDAGHLDEDGHLRIVDRLEHVGALADGTPFAPRLIENKLRVSPYIREAAVFGDGREATCALIDIDPVAVGRWADKRSVTYTGHADLASRDEVYGLVADCIAQVNAGLAADPLLAGAQVRRFIVLPAELSADEGLLTRTGKLKRSAAAQRFAPAVQALYAGEGQTPDGLKIRDAKTFAPTVAPRRAGRSA